MIGEKIEKILKHREFVSVATCGFDGKPNAAPKFILKTDKNFIYLVDYVFGRTWQNLKANPRASLSFTDTDSLVGYQINGSVEVIEDGVEHDRVKHELLERQIDLSTKRIIEGIKGDKAHKGFAAHTPEKMVIFKIKVEDMAEISVSGVLRREKV